MHQFMKYAFVGLAMVCAGILSGCVSRQAGAQLGAVVMGGVLEVALDPGLELAYASNEFRMANHRWPRDYDELSSFLKQTGDRTYPSFQAVKYDRIHFTETTDGKLRVEADYTLNSARKLDSGVAFNYSGSGRINGMVVSPFDPDEMMLQPCPQDGANGGQSFDPQTNRASAAAVPSRSP